MKERSLDSATEICTGVREGLPNDEHRRSKKVGKDSGKRAWNVWRFRGLPHSRTRLEDSTSNPKVAGERGYSAPSQCELFSLLAFNTLNPSAPSPPALPLHTSLFTQYTLTKVY